MIFKSQQAPILALVSISAFAASSPALAEDWTQGYIGFGIGADVLTGSGTIATVAGDTLHGEAPFGGDLGLSVSVGADYQLNSHFVAGVFATYDWSNIDTNAAITNGVDTISASLIKIDSGFTVGGRLGVLVTPQSMIYALLGYSWLNYGDIKASGMGQTFRFAMPDTSGWTTGFGFEHKLNHNVSLRGEYRYTAFEKQTLFADPAIGSVSGESQNHTARLVAAYRFGGNDSTAAESTPDLARSWGGAYIGGGFGVDAYIRDLNVDVAGIASGSLNGLGGGGFGGTLIAGYDVPVAANVIVGAFADYGFSNSKFKVGASSGGTGVSAELLSLDDIWTIGARLGIAMTNDVLLYGLAGYSRVHFNDASLSANGNSITLSFPSLDGVTLGGGFEKDIGNNLSLRAEYRYTMLEDTTIVIVPRIAGLDIDSSMHSAKLIATYRFSNTALAP